MTDLRRPSYCFQNISRGDVSSFPKYWEKYRGVDRPPSPHGDIRLGGKIMRRIHTRASITPKPLMHIFPISAKSINFLHVFVQFTFWHNLRFLLPPILTMMHLCIMLYTSDNRLGKAIEYDFQWAYLTFISSLEGVQSL